MSVRFISAFDCDTLINIDYVVRICRVKRTNHLGNEYHCYQAELRDETLIDVLVDGVGLQEHVVPAASGWKIILPIWEAGEVVDVCRDDILAWGVSDSGARPYSLDSDTDSNVVESPSGRIVALGDREIEAGELIDYFNNQKS